MRKYKVKIFSIGIAAVLAAGSYFIYQCDFFQKSFYPEKYWQIKLDDAEGALKFANALKRAAYREMAKIQITGAIDIEGSTDSSEALGIPKETARELAIQEVRNEIKAQKQIIEEYENFTKLCVEEIEKAKKELAKLRSAE